MATIDLDKVGRFSGELKVCPFCGGQPKIVKGFEGIDEDEVETFEVVCTNPDCIIYNGYSRSRYSREAAKLLWNNRVD